MDAAGLGWDERVAAEAGRTDRLAGRERPPERDPYGAAGWDMADAELAVYADRPRDPHGTSAWLHAYDWHAGARDGRAGRKLTGRHGPPHTEAYLSGHAFGSAERDESEQPLPPKMGRKETEIERAKRAPAVRPRRGEPAVPTDDPHGWEREAGRRSGLMCYYRKARRAGRVRVVERTAAGEVVKVTALDPPGYRATHERRMPSPGGGPWECRGEGADCHHPGLAGDDYYTLVERIETKHQPRAYERWRKVDPDEPEPTGGKPFTYTLLAPPGALVCPYEVIRRIEANLGRDPAVLYDYADPGITERYRLIDDWERRRTIGDAYEREADAPDEPPPDTSWRLDGVWSRVPPDWEIWRALVRERPDAKPSPNRSIGADAVLEALLYARLDDPDETDRAEAWHALAAIAMRKDKDTGAAGVRHALGDPPKDRHGNALHRNHYAPLYHAVRAIRDLRYLPMRSSNYHESALSLLALTFNLTEKSLGDHYVTSGPYRDELRLWSILSDFDMPTDRSAPPA